MGTGGWGGVGGSTLGFPYLTDLCYPPLILEDKDDGGPEQT